MVPFSTTNSSMVATPVTISGLTMGTYERFSTTARVRRLMLFTPMAASVPSTVAMMAEAKATTSETPSACRIISSPSKFLYQRSEKPAHTLRLFDSLKLNAISTAMGTYIKPNAATIHTRPRYFQRLIPSPPFLPCRRW